LQTHNQLKKGTVQEIVLRELRLYRRAGGAKGAEGGLSSEKAQLVMESTERGGNMRFWWRPRKLRGKRYTIGPLARLDFSLSLLSGHGWRRSKIRKGQCLVHALPLSHADLADQAECPPVTGEWNAASGLPSQQQAGASQGPRALWTPQKNSGRR
jgi:hypothetical protein